MWPITDIGLDSDIGTLWNLTHTHSALIPPGWEERSGEGLETFGRQRASILKQGSDGMPWRMYLR
jgi:hypothetical protein